MKRNCFYILISIFLTDFIYFRISYNKFTTCRSDTFKNKLLLGKYIEDHIRRERRIKIIETKSLSWVYLPLFQPYHLNKILRKCSNGMQWKWECWVPPVRVYFLRTCVLKCVANFSCLCFLRYAFQHHSKLCVPLGYTILRFFDRILCSLRVRVKVVRGAQPRQSWYQVHPPPPTGGLIRR